MSESFLTPPEMGAYAQEAALKKARTKNGKLFVLAMLGGLYVGFGGMFATLIATGSLGILPFGIAKSLMGIAFSLGLISVVVGGAELFTGSTVLSLAVVDKKIGWSRLFSNLSIVYAGNFVGSLILAAMVLVSKHYQVGSGAVGKMMLTIATSKLHYGFSQVLVLGILCNLFVCLAIWLTYGSKQITGKILAIIFPITAFVALGFEHCVANMYMIPVAWMIKFFDPAFVASANMDVSTLTISHFLLANLLPATIGNVIGGSVIWLSYLHVYREQPKLVEQEA
ncbi:formate/nitrite transporter family protein [Candidatus Falkowbacteria bacterium]|nr:formate/nitrite transporter family protein [Candidatus Falkowbacteria bacterium]